MWRQRILRIYDVHLCYLENEPVNPGDEPAEGEEVRAIETP